MKIKALLIRQTNKDNMAYVVFFNDSLLLTFQDLWGNERPNVVR